MQDGKCTRAEDLNLLPNSNCADYCSNIRADNAVHAPQILTADGQPPQEPSTPANGEA
jgi:hypothetical protein